MSVLFNKGGALLSNCGQSKSFLPSTSKNCKLLLSSCFLSLQVIGWCHFQLY